MAVIAATLRTRDPDPGAVPPQSLIPSHLRTTPTAPGLALTQGAAADLSGPLMSPYFVPEHCFGIPHRWGGEASRFYFIPVASTC